MLHDWLLQFHKARVRRMAKRSVVSLLACCLLLGTVVKLLIPAYTQEKPTCCGLEAHVHTEDCYERVLSCGLEEDETHTHSEACCTRVLTCQLPEHAHSLACYADPAADLESEADWLASIPSFGADTAPSERLVQIARSQLGYRESAHNYIVLDNDEIEGYTRYGAWAGEPYAAWNTALVRFCLYYADVPPEQLPVEADASAWRAALESCGLFEGVHESAYYPRPGDLVFYTGENGEDCVGVVTESDAETGDCSAVCGDTFSEVRSVSFARTEARLLGFGRLPEALRPAEAEKAIETTEETAQPVETEAPAEPSAPAQTEPTTEPTGPELIVLTAELEDYTISVQLHTLPEGNYQLSATPLTATQEQIRQVEDSQAEELPGGVSRRAEVDDADLLLFDICILDENGLEYQPEETVRVNVCQNRPAQAEELPAVVHFSKEGPESLDVQEEEDGFGFDTDGFSVYAFAFTVDFYYEGFEYHLPGEGSILLSQLLTMLCIERDVSEVTSVSFSDPTLISVTRQGSDWLLTSLASFDTQETLTVVMENGDTYSIDVTDPKGYSFYFNVNDSAAGCVYSRSTQYGESLTMAVTNDGVCQSSVRPRSAETPTNGNFTASYGYEFHYWVRDGYIYHGRGNENPSTAGYLYDIQPQVGQYGVEDRATTFTACFAPTGQAIITFSPYLDGWGYGQVNSGGEKVFNWTDSNGGTQQTRFCYSGSAYGMVAQAYSGGVFIGWYDTSTNELICDAAVFVPPADLDHDITVQARFRQAQNVTVTYQSYDTKNPTSGCGNVTIHNQWWYSAQSVSEQVLEGNVPSGAWVDDYNGYTFVCWRGPDNEILTREHDLNLSDPVFGDVSYRAEFLKSSTRRVLVRCNARDYGSVYRGSTDLTDGWLAEGTQNGNLVLPGEVRAVPAENYVFDHWELNGQRFSGDTATAIQYLNIAPNTGTNVQELTAVFQPICHVQYDLGVIQQIGNNEPGNQHWQDEPWCPVDVRVDREGLTELGTDLYQEDTSVGTTLTLPDLTQQTRISQTNNDYNLLTNTFKGWRIEGDSSGTIYRPGQTLYVTGPVKLIAIWDAYFDGKNGYYGPGNSSDYRYNTNTCGFFIRYYDPVFDIDDTSTYTECLFSTRLICDPMYNGNGTRADFYGNSVATDFDEIDAIDAYLRSHAATGIEARSDTSFAGSVMRLDLPFPSDEFIFGRLRMWNEFQEELNTGRRIIINGEPVPQEKLTPEYFDVRWYVLKDQQNSWHIDGTLLPKDAKLVVTKRFDGDADAIAAVKNGWFYIGVDTDESKTNGGYQEQYQLNLQPWSESNPTGYRMIDASGQYVWLLEGLQPLESYWVAEHNDTAPNPYASSRSWRVYNTEQTEISGTDARVRVAQVRAYADDVTLDEIQTVAFTNRYTGPRELTLVKLDSSTGQPISQVSFRFTLYAVQEDGSTVEITRDFETTSDGRITIPIPQTTEQNGRTVTIRSWQSGGFDGRHRFSITESPHQGYKALEGPITGCVTLYDDRGSVLTLDGGTDPRVRVEQDGDGSILFVENESETKLVSVRKQWLDGASRPVNMQLLCNDVPVPGKEVTLGADAERVSEDPAHNTQGWNWIWSELPAYVNGEEAVYTVREAWIGTPGGADSLHYNTNADADGYADYTVSVTKTTDESGNTAVVVTNAPDGGQIVFAKIDDLLQAVPGAEFTVYRDSACQIPIGAEDFRDGTDKTRPAVFVSDENGVVTIPALRSGVYYLKETKAALGWVLSDTEVYTLRFGGEDAGLTGIDPETGQPRTVRYVVNPVYAAAVTIRKTVTGTDTPLAGAVFSVHAALADGSMDPAPIRGLAELQTGPDGLVSLGRLRRGVYYLVEEEAPPGFERISEAIRVTVPDSGATKVSAIKVGSYTGLPVSSDGVITVGNSRGVTLPATGGSGSREDLGTALLAAAGLGWLGLLAPRRRRREECDGA